jgi:hypothetical protein
MATKADAAPGTTTAPRDGEQHRTASVADARETAKALPWLVAGHQRRELMGALAVSLCAQRYTAHQRRLALEMANRRRCRPPLEPEELIRIVEVADA